MFLDFYYALREESIPATPASLLTLMRALERGMVRGLDDLYVAARTILVKSERDFDAYDRVFLSHFGPAAPLDPAKAEALRAFFGKPFADWLRSTLSDMPLSVEERQALEAMALEELMALFEKRLREQGERHDGGSRYIGTRGTSPFGNAGVNPAGIRVGGESRAGSALKVAGERRFRDYAREKALGRAEMGELFRMLRDLRREGPKDVLDVEETIRETERLAGEIEPVFVRGQKDKLEVVLLIDNGGFSMDPYTDLVAGVFHEARRAFRKLDIYYFHNTIYDAVYKDARRSQPLPSPELLARDPATRLLVVGDASMGADELDSPYGNINYWEPQAKPSRARILALRERFRHAAWLNPKARATWPRTRGAWTIAEIGRIIPMFDMTVGGVAGAIDKLRGARKE